MTSGRPAAGEERGPGERVVISSITGRPMSWEGTAAARGQRPDDAPVLPDRMRDEGPEPGTDESNDERLSRDVPPHWGRGA